MSNPVKYANWWSKLLFKKKFENQFFIPVPPSWIEQKIFLWLEKKLFNKDLSNWSVTKPIFIVGLPRSGTTVLYNLLCAHQDAAFVTNSMNAFPEALCTIEWLRKKLNLNISGERFLADSIDVDFGSPSEPLTLWGKWMSRDAQSLHWEEKRINDLRLEKVEEIKNDIRKILFCFGGPQKRFVTKYPLMQTEMRIVQDLFPDARFIHILRDPRPAANSLAKLYHLSNDQLKRIDHPDLKTIIPYPRVKNLKTYIDTYGADSLECTSRVWMDAIEVVHQVAPTLPHFYEFKYEDLLANPVSQLREIFAFCDLTWPESNNEVFQAELKKLGHVRHKNEYTGYELIEKITQPVREKVGY